MDWIDECHIGDCRDLLREMAANGLKVQTCITSPPYFGLRDYGHDGQIGLEETPEHYIGVMVDVLRAVREVLADDGTLWLNIGDSYTGAANNGGDKGHTLGGTQNATGRTLPTKRGDGLKPKDLIGIPWALAFALRADGWYLRQDIIWHKPNPMPESVTDRCTKAHEYLFLLSKAERYYFDVDAMRERSLSPGRNPGGNRKVDASRNDAARDMTIPVAETRNRRSVWTIASNPYAEAHFAVFPPALIEPCVLAGSRAGDTVLDPFFGSGTTGEVAQRLDRHFIGCELNPAYVPLQNRRTAQLSIGLENGTRRRSSTLT
jgi:DNA modification methylase